MRPRFNPWIHLNLLRLSTQAAASSEQRHHEPAHKPTVPFSAYSLTGLRESEAYDRDREKTLIKADKPARFRSALICAIIGRANLAFLNERTLLGGRWASQIRRIVHP